MCALQPAVVAKKAQTRTWVSDGGGNSIRRRLAAVSLADRRGVPERRFSALNHLNESVNDYEYEWEGRKHIVTSANVSSVCLRVAGRLGSVAREPRRYKAARRWHAYALATKALGI